jgi:hypothetical protein
MHINPKLFWKIYFLVLVNESKKRKEMRKKLETNENSNSLLY